MHYNYKPDEKILKSLIHRNILSTDPNKIIKLIYYNKFKTSNLVIKNNSSTTIGILQKTNIIYQFKWPLGDCISENDNTYVGLTSTTLSRRLTMHLSDTSSMAQHLKKHSCPTTELQKILTEFATVFNIKITSKNYRFSRYFILGTYNPNIIELIFKPVLMYLNVFSN